MGRCFEQHGLVGAVAGIFRLFLAPGGVVEAFERRHHDALHCLGATEVNADALARFRGKKGARPRSD